MRAHVCVREGERKRVRECERVRGGKTAESKSSFPAGFNLSEDFGPCGSHQLSRVTAGHSDRWGVVGGGGGGADQCHVRQR